ncbi:hypothetical protein KEM48_012950 [Puccinia striiformis f. sp. tritici PST-130]|nr:hypothetical protein H4Q26_013948 [Puccinia striiformis f. sp. tritici PST-130]KAI9629481.1 hypothetical protein KEM48_012950 [Puccinia striiformis f. sp. tritici PST-130]
MDFSKKVKKLTPKEQHEKKDLMACAKAYPGSDEEGKVSRWLVLHNLSSNRLNSNLSGLAGEIKLVSSSPVCF